MEYQAVNSVAQDRYEKIIYEPFQFPPHLHRFLELTYVMEGELEITINGQAELMRAGDMAFVFPNHPHSYSRRGHNRAAVFIIANGYIPSVVPIIDHNVAKRYVFTPDRYVTEVLTRCLLQPEQPDAWEIKATVYLLMHAFLRENSLEPNHRADADLLQRMLGYVSENFRNNISMAGMAAELGYDRQYLSRKLNEMLRMSFRAYLNLYRIDFATTLLKETEMGITSIALEAGFQNTRSFNRAFLSALGVQPLKYRQKSRNK